MHENNQINKNSKNNKKTQKIFSPDKPGEKCGVFGIYSSNKNVAEFIFYGLQALQHRGQESAGIAVSDGEDILVFKDLGLVSQVFSEQNLAPLVGSIGIGHTRYSTTGLNIWDNSQPLYRMFKDEVFAIAHNGNLTNTEYLRRGQMRKGIRFETSTDTEVIASLIESSLCSTLEEAIKEAVYMIKGSYSLVILSKDTLFAIRDPHGFRPMVLGKKEEDYIIASETCALDIIDAKFMREVDPGEIIIINRNGLRSQMMLDVDRISMCVFELIYFARPDSYLYNKNIFEIRHRMGRQLAIESPADADIVIGVPDSGTPAAQGFSAQSGIPYTDGLIKNRYIGRTFIQPTQEIRQIGVKLKLNPLKEVIRGKRLVVVDDSIVRGTTSKKVIQMLYNAGAKQIHMRITSPPLLFPCYYGIDMATKKEFIASYRTLEDIRKYLNLDSLSYLSIEGLVSAIGQSRDKFCFACFNGDYPVAVDEEMQHEKDYNKRQGLSSIDKISIS
ncbi:MAG: amidophosphoribosyltransferase [Actinobacteria bacterium]|nr:amidophosphoribosyltransferase [Actinomycetota bacterium]